MISELKKKQMTHLLSKKIASENSECCIFACEKNGHKQKFACG